MNQHLYILWTSGDPLTAHFTVLQYAISCITQDWWDEVTVILWGAAAKLSAEDRQVQERLRVAMDVGVHISVCSTSARQLGVREQLEALGIEGKAWGHQLSQLIQNRAHLLTV